MSNTGPAGGFGIVERLAAVVRRRLGWAVALMYLLAATVPAPGLWLRRPHLSAVAPLALHPAAVLLALMLFTAAMQVPAEAAAQVLRRPSALVAGLVAHLVAPLLILPALIVALRWLPDADHGAGLLAGLVLVTAMPVATGATVWVGKGCGDQPTMVSLVVASTLISPLTVPLTVTAMSALLDDTVADRLEGGTAAGANSFTLLAVLAPCAAGIACRLLLPQAASARLVRGCTPAALFGSRRRALTVAPSVPLLALATAMAAVACVLSFALGRVTARALRLHSPQAASVTLACGMSNSSAGAVLVSTVLPARPHALLPVLAYSLLQKLAADRATRPILSSR